MFRLTQSLRKSASLNHVKSFSQTTKPLNSQNLKSNLHRPNNLEKKFLVWTGKYKALGDIPDRVAGEVVDKARNKIRIKVANGMIVLTLIGCLMMSISGKRAHDRGESVQKDNLEWHQSHKEESSK